MTWKKLLSPLNITVTLIIVAVVLLFLMPYGKERMATLLTRAERMNSDYIPMDTVTFMDEVLRFYDSHGTAEERIRANYMNGCVYRDRGDSPMALEYYLKAVSLADTTEKTCDHELLSRIYGQMAELFHKQRYPQKELEMWNNAIAMARKANDTMMYAECLAHSAEMYEFVGAKDKARKRIADAYSLYRKTGNKKYAASLLSIMASYDLERDSVQNAKQKIDGYICSSGLFDSEGNIFPGCEMFYFTLGQYYEKTDKPDSAIYYYKRLMEYNGNVGNIAGGSKGLMSVYQKLHETDSVVKYANFYKTAIDSTMSTNSIKEISRVKELYDYSCYKKELLTKETEANALWNLLAVITMAFVLTGILIYLYTQRQKRNYANKTEEANAKYKVVLAEYNEAVAEYRRYKIDKTAYEKNMLKKIQHLQATLSTYQNDLDAEELLSEQNIHHHQIVETFHNYAAKYMTPTEKDWNVLLSVVEKLLPSFFSDLHKANYQPSAQEVKFCMLTRLGFRLSDICILMNITKQRASNLRSRLNEKLFRQNGSKTFTSNLYRL